MDLQQKRIDVYNRSKGSESAINCNKCNNKGYIMALDSDGYEVLRECECMKARRVLVNQSKSGLIELLEQCTFDTFKVTNLIQEDAKKQVEEFAENPNGWLVLSGRTGTGKTHLSVAVIGKLLNNGKACKYMMWRDEVPKLKAMINEIEYEKQMDFLKTVEVLYIDDFFKGSISQADVNLAFELLNHRAVKKLTTIISTELTLNAISKIDGAIAGRLVEHSKVISMQNGENYRLRGVKAWRA